MLFSYDIHIRSCVLCSINYNPFILLGTYYLLYFITQLLNVLQIYKCPLISISIPTLNLNAYKS